MQRALALVVSATLLALVPGCQGFNLGGEPADDGGSSDDDGSSSDANLGDFALGLHLEDSTCGEGAMGLSDSWSFDVALSHEGDVGYWSSGGAKVQGEFDEAARTLDFVSGVTIDMRSDAAPGSDPLPACSIVRTDDATFTLDAVTAARTLDGDLTYTFTPAANTNCADLVYGSSPQFVQLPCTMHYRVAGTVKSD